MDKLKFAGAPTKPTTVTNIARVKEIIIACRRLTVKDFADDVGISIRSWRAFFSWGY